MAQVNVKQLEQKRQQLLAERKKKTMLPMILTLASIVIFIIGLAVSSGALAGIFFLLMIVAGIWWILVAMKYKKMMKGAILDELFKLMNLNLKYNAKSKRIEFNKKLLSTNFFGMRAGQRYAEDIIAGEFEGMPFVMGDVHVKQKRGENRYVTIFRGPIGYIQIDQKLPQVTLLPDTAEKYLGGVGKLLNKVSIRQVNQKNIYFNEDPDFEKRFIVWTKDENYARSLLTPEFRSFLTNKAGINPIYLTIKDNFIILGVDLRRDSFVIKMKKPITQNTIDTMQNDFTIFSDLLKEIKSYILGDHSTTKQQGDDVPPPPQDDNVPPPPDSNPQSDQGDFIPPQQ